MTGVSNHLKRNAALIPPERVTMPWPMLYYRKRPSWICGSGEGSEAVGGANSGGITTFRGNCVRRHRAGNPCANTAASRDENYIIRNRTRTNSPRRKQASSALPMPCRAIDNANCECANFSLYLVPKSQQQAPYGRRCERRLQVRTAPPPPGAARAYAMNHGYLCERCGYCRAPKSPGAGGEGRRQLPIAYWNTEYGTSRASPAHTAKEQR